MANIRHRYTPRQRDGIRITDPVITKQSSREECDINTIMAKYARTGVAPGAPGVGHYGDFYEMEDYLQAQIIIRQAEGQFAGLPAKVRERFQNDPSKFLAFVQDKSNQDEARKLGLLKDEVQTKDVPVTPPPAA